MKKRLYFINYVVLTMFFSCTQTEKEIIDYAIISGKITNHSDAYITIQSKFNRFSKKVALDENGTFNDTLRNSQGEYQIYNFNNHGEKRVNNIIPLYLTHEGVQTLNFDEKNHLETLKYEGSGSAISNYFFAKTKMEKEAFGDRKKVYTLEESKFKALAQETKSKIESSLNASNLTDEFKTDQKRYLHYEYLYRLLPYEAIHARYTKNEAFKVSSSFLNEINEVTYDNEEDYNFSGAYKRLIGAYAKKQTDKLLAENELLEKDLVYLQTYGSFTNENIKNDLLFKYSGSKITYTSHFEEFYALFRKLSTNDENNVEIEKAYNKLKLTAKDNPSPKFVNYENYAGGTTSLDDFKGKYIFIDVWATWCGPCRKQIPFLEKIEHEFSDKNIEFLSISIDKTKDRGKWLKMIEDKELGGVQLLADNAWDSKFVQDYSIRGIPRFILLNPEGNIVTANAPWPSQPELKEMLNELGI